MGELNSLLVFQVEIDCTLPIDTHQLPVMNRVEVPRLLRVTVYGDNLTAEERMVAAYQLGYHLALISYGNAFDNRRFDHFGRNCFQSGCGEFIYGSP